MNVTTFPIPFNAHLILCIIGAVFFLVQFIRLKKPYQLIMSVAIASSLLIYLNKSETLFYIVGLFEVIAILSSIISTIIIKIKNHSKKVEQGK